MTWNNPWPVGNISVEDNRLVGNENTDYIETKMNLDHYWDTSTNQDGHHKFVQMDLQGTVAAPSDAALATGMEGAIYIKAKSATEAVDNQDAQPFFINNNTVETPGTTQIMQLLGIRAMGVFDETTVNGAVTLQYSHNCTVTRTNTGLYTINFTNNLPSNNYLIVGGGVSKNVTEVTTVSVVNNADIDQVKATNFCLIKTNTISQSGSVTRPDLLQTWFVVFGG